MIRQGRVDPPRFHCRACHAPGWPARVRRVTFEEAAREEIFDRGLSPDAVAACAQYQAKRQRRGIGLRSVHEPSVQDFSTKGRPVAVEGTRVVGGVAHTQTDRSKSDVCVLAQTGDEGRGRRCGL